MHRGHVILLPAVTRVGIIFFITGIKPQEFQATAMRLLPIFLLAFSCVAWGQILNNPNNLPLCSSKHQPSVCYSGRIGEWGYEGEMKGGLRHGVGIYYFTDGSIQEGIWDENKFSRAEKVTPTSAPSDFEKNFGQAKAECESIGFKPTTEPFANCVLKLVEQISSSANIKKLEPDVEQLQKTLRAEESQRLRQDAIERLNKTYKSEESRQKQASDDLMNDRSFRDRNQREMCRSRGDQYCD